MARLVTRQEPNRTHNLLRTDGIGRFHKEKDRHRSAGLSGKLVSCALSYASFENRGLKSLGKSFPCFLCQAAEPRLLRTAQLLFYASSGAQEADAYGRFRPTVLPGNFLHFVAFYVVTFQNHSIVRLAVA